MPFDLNPDSYKRSLGSFTWRNFLSDLDSWATNTSAHWSVDQTADSGSGDYGLTLSPDASGESFQANLRYDDSGDTGNGPNDDDRLYAAIDPGASISNAYDPVSSGSSKVSTERTYAGPATPGYGTDYLIAEYDDALIVVFKDGAGGVPWILQIGRLLYPLFANDPNNDVDGLGFMAAPPRFEPGLPSSRYLMQSNNNNNNGSEMRIGTSGWTPATALAECDDTASGWDSFDLFLSHEGESRQTPVPISVREMGSSTPRRGIGIAKYVYVWTTKSILARLDGGGGEGLLVVNSGGNNAMVVPWDPGVTP